MKNRLVTLLQLIRDWWRVPLYQPHEWTPADQAQLRYFLSTPSGLRMCARLDAKVQELCWAAATDGKPHSAGVAMGVRVAHNFLGVLAGMGQPATNPTPAPVVTQAPPSSQPAGADGLEHLSP